MKEFLLDLYKSRALLIALVTRQLATRYRGSVLGFLWSFLNPLLFMLIYSLVFKYYIRFDQVEHYSIFLFCGLLPWTWTQSALLEGVASISSSGHLLTKSLFPAHILPAVSTITSLINFLLSLPLLFIFMLVAGVEFHLSILLLPVLIFIQSIFLLGISVIAASLNVYLRDIQHVLGHLLNLTFFLCPILYPISTVPDKFKFTMFLNPFALFIDFYHALILEGRIPGLVQSAYLLAFVFLSFILGIIIYQNYREEFAEAL